MKERNKRLLSTAGGTIILGVFLFIVARIAKIDPAFLISVDALFFALYAHVEKQDKDK